MSCCISLKRETALFLVMTFYYSTVHLNAVNLFDLRSNGSIYQNKKKTAITVEFGARGKKYSNTKNKIVTPQKEYNQREKLYYALADRRLLILNMGCITQSNLKYSG